MDWIRENWQTIAALLIVGATLLIFVFRIAKAGKKDGCGGGCGCDAKRAGDRRG